MSSLLLSGNTFGCGLERVSLGKVGFGRLIALETWFLFAGTTTFQIHGNELTAFVDFVSSNQRA